MFVKFMIVVIPLFGAVVSLVTSDICPEYNQQICSCNVSENAEIIKIPVKMCYDGNECKACPMDLQDHIDCRVCTGNTCTVCSKKKFSKQPTEKSDAGMDIKKFGQKSRNVWKLLPPETWCAINMKIKNGKLECSSTREKKECVVSCFDPYTVDGQKKMTFLCNRKRNVWQPQLQTCEDKTDAYSRKGEGEDMEKSDRKSLNVRKLLTSDPWCPVNINMKNGKFECTSTDKKKECVVSCFDTYTVEGLKKMTFLCFRKRNIWQPQLKTCEDKTGVHNRKGADKSMERASRESRDLQKLLNFDSWCMTDMSIENGKLECTTTNKMKECVVSCFEPYTVGGQKTMTFKCYRKKNAWKPGLQNCKYNGNEPKKPNIPRFTISKIPEFPMSHVHEVIHLPMSENDPYDYADVVVTASDYMYGHRIAPDDVSGDQFSYGQDNSFTYYTSYELPQYEDSSENTLDDILGYIYDILHFD